VWPLTLTLSASIFIVAPVTRWSYKDEPFSHCSVDVIVKDLQLNEGSHQLGLTTFISFLLWMHLMLSIDHRQGISWLCRIIPTYAKEDITYLYLWVYHCASTLVYWTFWQRLQFPGYKLLQINDCTTNRSTWLDPLVHIASILIHWHMATDTNLTDAWCYTFFERNY
jgi:hypothetical protein